LIEIKVKPAVMPAVRVRRPRNLAA